MRGEWGRICLRDLARPLRRGGRQPKVLPETRKGGGVTGTAAQRNDPAVSIDNRLFPCPAVRRAGVATRASAVPDPAAAPSWRGRRPEKEA